MDFHHLDMRVLLALKLVLYFVVMLVGARGLRSAERPSPRPLLLALIALGRMAAGIPVGPLVALGVAAGTGHNIVAGLVGMAVAGFGLWFAAGKFAFRGAPGKHIALFALAAEI